MRMTLIAAFEFPKFLQEVEKWWYWPAIGLVVLIALYIWSGSGNYGSGRVGTPNWGIGPMGIILGLLLGVLGTLAFQNANGTIADKMRKEEEEKKQEELKKKTPQNPVYDSNTGVVTVDNGTPDGQELAIYWKGGSMTPPSNGGMLFRQLKTATIGTGAREVWVRFTSKDGKEASADVAAKVVK